ncbi:C40 family peptidase [Streptomyces bambusae]|uniref:C40 family peptidase n=1 Tax=Streptomyces bambusae TaxID=1550616 RepID=UPI001CFE2D68|nr:C40 family peptidase [Streptomyces bambusae]MCB5164703.1 C40 family peptidase [Streptomyces bambusae]
MIPTKIALVAAVTAVTALVPLASTASAAPEPAPHACKGAKTCYVNVSVAQLWESPDKVRAVDAKALTNPVDLRGWFADMAHDINLRRDIPGETQALYGNRVTVVATTRTRDGMLWDKVLLHGQPTPKDKAGYPGWVPDRQLTKHRKKAPAGTTPERISSRTAWGFGTPQAAASGSASRGGTEYSFNTEFSVKPSPADPSLLEAYANDGSPIYFKPQDLTAPPPDVTGGTVVAEARKFLGQDYLWSGASGFGYDCSGLTSQVYSALGITIPRDSQPQFDAGGGRAPAGSARGVRIDSEADLRPGDVVGFGSSTANVTHVGIYAGRNDKGEPMMIDAPKTGEKVKEEPMTGRPFVGATRFIGA